MNASVTRRHRGLAITTLGGAALVAAAWSIAPVWGLIAALPVLTAIMLEAGALRGHGEQVEAHEVAPARLPRRTEQGRTAQLYDLSAHRAARGPRTATDRADGSLAPVLVLDDFRTQAPQLLRAHG